jgi:aminoglycoside phosphotransferase (APT) family kinase protein
MTRNVETLDTDKLCSYLEEHVDGFRGPLSVEKFSNGQSNPTFRLNAASGTYVLRRQPPGELLKSAHAVDREFRVLRALRDTPVPVPNALHLCEDRELIGSMFYVMDYCAGRVYFPAHLPEIDSNAERAAMYDALNEVLVAIHSLDLDTCGLADYGKPGAYFERQLNHRRAGLGIVDDRPPDRRPRLPVYAMAPAQRNGTPAGTRWHRPGQPRDTNRA